MLDLRLAVDESAFGDMPTKIRCLNPNHDDPAASLAVYPDNLHCYGCGWHRNDADEALALLLGISKVEAATRLHQYDSDKLDAYREKVAKEARRDPMPYGVAVMYNRFLREQMPQRLEWFYERGLTDETIDTHLLGHDGYRFSIPVFDSNHQLLTIRFRRDDLLLPEMWDCHDATSRVPKYSGTKSRNGLYLYGEHWLSQMESDSVIVTEGELDALRLWQAGLCGVSATNGARQSARVPSLLYGLSERVDTIIAATDMDEPGEEAATRLAKAATEAGMTCIRWAWIDGKDITEHLQRYGLEDIMKGVWNGQRFCF
jgi:DNA primase